VLIWDTRLVTVQYLVHYKYWWQGPTQESRTADKFFRGKSHWDARVADDILQRCLAMHGRFVNSKFQEATGTCTVYTYR